MATIHVSGRDTILDRERTTGPEGRRIAYKPPRRATALVLPRPPSQSLGGLPLMEGRGRGGRSRFVTEETALRLTKPVCVIPAKAGIQPWDTTVVCQFEI